MFPGAYFPKVYFPGTYFPPAAGSTFSWLALDVARLLASAGLGTVGGDVFVGGFPPEPVAALAVIDRKPLLPADWTMAANRAGVALEYPICEVLARAGTYAAARSRLELAYRTILGFRGGRLGRAVYASLEPLSAPYWVGEEEAGAQVLGFEVEAAKGLTRI